MSAIELLQKVKNLPPEEQILFAKKFHEWESPGSGPKPAKQKKIKWPDAQSRHRRVFGDKLVLENMVLVARELERY